MSKKQVDVLIVYERKQRELENAVILQISLEKEGISTKIVQYYETSGFNIFNIRPPKIIIVPHLYNTKSFYRILSRFGHATHIVNLQYEQVLSEKWERLGAHTPKGMAQNAIHVCWGRSTFERLSVAGTPHSNLRIIPPIHFDLLKNDFYTKKTRSDLSVRFNINNKKKWSLFISSFTYADISDNRLRMNEGAANTKLNDFPTIHTESRNTILAWLRSALTLDKDNILIYRPHPDEISLDAVLMLRDEFPNFFIIREGSVKEWIGAADALFTWYSTSIVEAHFMDKPYSILRPHKLPDSFDSVLLKHGRFISNQDQFLTAYESNGVKTKAIDDEVIHRYYERISDRPARSQLVELVKQLLSRRPQVAAPSSSVHYWMGKLKTLLVYPVHFVQLGLSRVNIKPPLKDKTLLGLIITEIENQVADSSEKEDTRERVQQVLNS